MKKLIFYRNGNVVEDEIVETMEATTEEKVSLAQQYLEETDYRIIKCMESFLLGVEPPYDIE